jgi:hypothetical protein
MLADDLEAACLQELDRRVAAASGPYPIGERLHRSYLALDQVSRHHLQEDTTDPLTLEPR